MSADLSEDPIVIAMATRLRIDEFSVVGRLHRIWSWADRHLSDGLALGITPEWIDQFVRLEGFSNALLEVGWLSLIEKGELLDSSRNLLDSFSETFLDSSRNLLDSRDGGGVGGVVFPRFFRFLSGRTTKTNAKTKTNPTPTRVRENEIEKDRESTIEKEIEKESRKIEKDEAFSIFWKAYPRKDSKVPAQKAFAKLAPSAELLEQILVALDRFRGCDQWTREGGKFVPFASTWLNQRRWEDESTPSMLPQAFAIRMAPEERRRAISEANGAAWLAQDAASDPNVIDMEQ
jgi:hypothetical protein